MDETEQDASFVEREQEQAAAREKLKQVKKARPAKEKQPKDKQKTKKALKWWKEFRGELKKIVWPSFGSVIKNTGIVLLTTAVIGALVWVMDMGLTSAVRGVRKLSAGILRSQEVTPELDPDLDLDLDPSLIESPELDPEDVAETEGAPQSDLEPVPEMPASTPVEGIE